MSGSGFEGAASILLKAAPWAVTALLVAYVGGPAMVVFVGSLLVTAAALQRSNRFRAGIGVLVALIIHVSWLMIYMGMILQRVLKVPGLRALAAQPLEHVGFHPVDFPANSVQLFWFGSLAVLAAPGIVSAIVLLRGRAQYRPFSQPVLGRLTWMSALVPFALVALFKLFAPWHALAFTMSGDGRNHFLIIEEIRAQSSVDLSPLTLTAPKLSNALGSLLSSGNGSTGTLQTGDLWAMLSVYVLSASMIIVATLTGFVTAVKTRPESRWIAMPLVVVAFLLATNSLVMSTVLHDGFLSLYFGTAVLGVSLVVQSLFPVGGTKVLILGAGVVGLIGAYSFLAPALGVVLVVEIYRWILSTAPSRRRSATLVAWSLVLVLGGALAARRNWDSFQATASLYGSVAPVDSGILWVLLALAATFWLTGSAESRSAGFTGSIAAIASLAMVVLIERVPANSGAAYSYYSSKTIVGAAGGILCLAFIPLHGLLSRPASGRRSLLLASAGLTAAALVPYAIAEDASPFPRPWSRIVQGWSGPDASSIQQVVRRWGDEPYVFFRFADNPPLVKFPSMADDRVLNFWSPVTWNSVGPWTPMYSWVYNEMDTLDAAELCSPIASGVHTVYTRDPALAGQIDGACGPSDVDVVVLPRESST